MYSFERELTWVRSGFSDPQFRKKVPNAPGVYIICLKNRPINRLIGIDESGILYVGKSDSIGSRLNKFYRSASSSGVRGHIGGVRYDIVGLRNHFQLIEVEFKYHLTQSDDEAKKIEAGILREYVSFHCEQPPLNYAASYS